MSNIETNNNVYTSSVLDSGIVTTNGLTPDALMLYLQDRMGSIDEQANAAFEKQQRVDAERKAIGVIQNKLSSFDPEHLPDKGAILSDTDKDLIMTAIAEIRTQGDDHVADNILATLKATPKESAPREEQELTFDNLNKAQLTELKTTLDNHAKALESSASLEMIHLQSVMSARQTAVQLATNLVSALGKSQEAIAANIGH